LLWLRRARAHQLIPEGCGAGNECVDQVTVERFGIGAQTFECDPILSLSLLLLHDQRPVRLHAFGKFSGRDAESLTDGTNPPFRRTGQLRRLEWGYGSVELLGSKLPEVVAHHSPPFWFGYVKTAQCLTNEDL
jgi:hypothetical protein